MVIGIGVDIIEVERIKGAIERHGQRFLDRVYCPGEIRCCRSSANSFQRFAARFAAKEAVLKALGVGWQDGTRFTDVEVVVNSKGRPSVKLSGKSRRIGEALGVSRVHISLSHTKRHAIAQAVAE